MCVDRRTSMSTEVGEALHVNEDNAQNIDIVNCDRIVPTSIFPDKTLGSVVRFKKFPVLENLFVR